MGSLQIDLLTKVGGVCLVESCENEEEGKNRERDREREKEEASKQRESGE